MRAARFLFIGYVDAKTEQVFRRPMPGADRGEMTTTKRPFAA